MSLPPLHTGQGKDKEMPMEEELVEQEDPVFVPQPIDTSAVRGR